MKLKKEVYGALLFSTITLSLPTCFPKSYNFSNSNNPIEQKKKVLLIGIDGLRVDALKKAKTPALDYLVTNGAYSFNSMAGEHTLSGPGWSTILTGVKENKHKVVNNTFIGNRLNQYPSLMNLVETFRPELKTSSFVSWQPLEDYFMNYADKHFYHPYHDNGDAFVFNRSAQELTSGNSDLAFVYFVGVDETGHRHGFHPSVKKYVQEIEKVDNYIAALLNIVHSRPTFRNEEWLYIAITDHGGTGKSHGGQSLHEKKVFYIATGDAVKKGEICPPPRQEDVLPTILNYLSIDLNRENFDGKVVGMRKK